MITVNDTNHVEKRAPSYRVRKQAMDAAVFELGPHARNGFEYTTVKCDGRWLWKPTDEVPPLSAAQIKAEGGKRCLVAQQKGTAMAIGPKLGPDRTIKNPPDAKAASNPSPTALVHGTDTSKWGKDRADRRARRKAAGETSMAPVSDSPKLAKRTGEAKTKLAGAPSKTAAAGALIARPGGCTSKDILDLTGWPSVSVPAVARACGLTLVKTKVDGVTRYMSR